MSNKSTQFKPGEVHNPNGRPPKEWTMASLIREAAEEANGDGILKKNIIARKLVDMASAGDIIAMKELNNRLDGMAVQSTDITSKGEKVSIAFHTSLKQDDE